MLAWLAAGCAIVPALVLGILLLIDPYEAGRTGPGLLGPGIPPQGPRTGHASRVRDPAFDAAILGNSHVQLLSPERLSSATGLRFVSLTVPATGVEEQSLLLRRFLAERPGTVRALVIGVDEYTCHSGAKVLRTNPFPSWLYADRRLDYVAGLFRLDAVEAAGRRLWTVLSRGEREHRDGWWDYEAGRQWTPALGEALARASVQPLADGPGPFPGVEALARTLAAAPSDIRVVLLIPPVYARLIPPPGSPEAAHERACRDRLAAIANSRSGTVLLDRRIDSPLTRDEKAFWDTTHYVSAVALSLEGDIAAAIRSR